MSHSLARASRNVTGTVSSIDWEALSPAEARRLREFGLDEGVEVELVKPVGWLGGPAAVRIGRMTVALRRHITEAIKVAVPAE
ncbi:FeoA family protein [Sphingomonas turrisvirgatae]|uniref:Iron transporter FeoA n=1 Tax=Sphingomonas turrisvirgatae TaxID=1888892 RepID=A0A1E3M0M1_9SPHN|nr:FeoA family protein [Sphingomonas turrisvirgatae]ODP39528.1 iron transporter FeoA [Sphingomonas turrisvirgatae]